MTIKPCQIRHNLWLSGQSPKGMVCTAQRISIIQDDGEFAASVTAAHELGHK